jgi:hypothetical protein
MTLGFVVLLTGLATGQLGEHIRISGQVQDAQMGRVSGAEVVAVELYGDDFFIPKSAKLLDTVKATDQEGRFAFDIWVEPEHDVLVVARKAGLALGWHYIYREHDFLTQPDTRITANIALHPPKGIAGRLVDPEGRAVVGAGIQVVPYIRHGGKDVYAPRDWLSKKTDAQGQFAFDNLPIEARVKFFVELSERDIVYVFPRKELQGNAGGRYRVDWEDVELQLPPASTVQGWVVDKTTDQGIRGLRLMLYPEHVSRCEWRFRGHEVFSGTNGAFEVTGLPPGLHILRFVSEDTDWAARVVPIMISGQDKTIEARVMIEKGIALKVLVRDRTTGRALPDITVYVDDRQNDQQHDIMAQRGQTDAKGIAQLNVPRGKYKMHVWGGNYSDGFQEQGIPLKVTGLRSKPVEISVMPLIPTVRGTVVDTLGQAAENVRVMVGLGQTVLTDNQGRFEARQNHMYPSHLVVVQDTARELAEARFFYDAVQELRVVLKPSSTIRGRVTDDMGRGIAGAKVSLGFKRKRRGRTRDVHGVVHLPDTRTDAQGFYEIKAVVPVTGARDHYRLTYHSADFSASSHVLDERMQSGERVLLPDVQLAPLDAYLSGVVLDQHDNPVPRKPVFVGSSAGGSHDSMATSTDEQGRFRVDRLPAGQVTVQVGFGQGGDAAYVFAQTGDQVTVKLGQHFTNYVSPDSLVGKPLPDLRTLEIGFDYERIKNKKVLLCFVDYTKRASQITLGLLKRFRLDLRRSHVEVVCVQVVPVDKEDLEAWKKENEILFPIHVLPGHSGWEDKTKPSILKQSPDSANSPRQQWGIRSLPWTILADENQTVMAGGLNIQRILTLVHEGKRLSPLRNKSERRRR